MNKGVNKWIGIGNICADPETRYSQSGDAITNTTVACNDSYKDKNSGEIIDKTEFVRVVFFKKIAEIAGKYLKKGSKVYIEGKLQTRKWQDKEGQDRYTTEIVARDMQMLDSRGEGQPRPQEKPKQQGYSGPPGAQQQAPNDDFGEDIPF